LLHYERMLMTSLRTALVLHRLESALIRRSLAAGSNSSPRRQVVARGLPNARVVVFPNANHFVFRSNEAQVIAEMRSFIDLRAPR